MSIKEVGLPSSRRAALCMTRDSIHLLLGVHNRFYGKLDENLPSRLAGWTSLPR